MPPKKKKEEEAPARVVLGRISGHLKMGLLGPPNVGKSSTFNLLTKMGVPAENFPFCTVQPSTSRAFVNDPRFEWLCEHFQPASKVKGFLDVVDIAGLVRGASQGEGLGNAFLSNVAAVDGLYHVVRAFDDPDVIHHDDEVNPLGDLDMITKELLAKDLENAEKQKARVEPLVRRGIDKTKKNELEAIEKVLEALRAGKQIRHVEWKPAEADYFRPYGLLTAKPVVYLVNVSKKDYLRKKNKYLLPIKQWIDEHSPGEKMIIYSASLENELADMDEEEREVFYKDNGTKSQLDNIIQSGFSALNLISFITAGADEVRMWTIYNGWKAPKAAGVIHGDFENYFVKADVYAYTDLKELGSEAAVREAGKLRMEGKEYVVKDGDVLHIKANPPASGKKK